MTEKIQVHAKISGRVQGVFFRQQTKQTAQAKGVTGWVKNCPDGSVEAVFEGEAEKVSAVLDWCRQGGPPAARVDQVQTSQSDDTGDFETFSVVA